MRDISKSFFLWNGSECIVRTNYKENIVTVNGVDIGRKITKAKKNVKDIVLNKNNVLHEGSKREFNEICHYCEGQIRMLHVYNDKDRNLIRQLIKSPALKLSLTPYKSFKKMRKEIHQCIEDGNKNIAPLLILFQKDPSGIKKEVGKGMWRWLSNKDIVFNRSLLLGWNLASYKPRLDKMETLRLIKSYNFENKEILECETKLFDFYLNDIIFVNLFGDLNYHEDERKRRTYWHIHDVLLMCDVLDRGWSPFWSATKWGKVNMKMSTDLGLFKMNENYPDQGLDDMIPNQKRFDKYFKNKNFDEGLKVKVLSTKNDFINEHQVMKHCIISYYDYCHEGKYIALSIDDGKERTTLGLSKWGKNIRFSQHFGVYDCIPSKERRDLGKEIFKNFVKDLSLEMA